jgi:CcmD family protein
VLESGGPRVKNLNSVMAAYLVVWTVFFVYQLTVSRRLAHLRDEIERLKDTLKR